MPEFCMVAEYLEHGDVDRDIFILMYAEINDLPMQ